MISDVGVHFPHRALGFPFVLQQLRLDLCLRCSVRWRSLLTQGEHPGRAPRAEPAWPEAAMNSGSCCSVSPLLLFPGVAGPPKQSLASSSGALGCCPGLGPQSVLRECPARDTRTVQSAVQRQHPRARGWMLASPGPHTWALHLGLTPVHQAGPEGCRLWPRAAGLLAFLPSVWLPHQVYLPSPGPS